MESIGRQKRRQASTYISKKFPEGTPIEKCNYPFSVSKSTTAVVKSASIIQFPIKLAFASTAHKVQGLTIPKPLKAIISTDGVNAAAIVYVMLSRVCCLEQLYILNELDRSKIYPSPLALAEFTRLHDISLNRRPSDWNREDQAVTKVISLNCRSLKKHFIDIVNDETIMKSHIICIQETWLEDNDDTNEFSLPGYKSAFNNQGKGKGTVTYYKENIFQHVMEINEEKFQISKLRARNIDLLNIYRSNGADHNLLIQALDDLITEEKPTIIIGDFNISFNESTPNMIKTYLKNKSFSKLINEPTHIDGNTIDQAMIKDTAKLHTYSSEVQTMYFTDHRALAILIYR